jgi:DNA-binding HxlR family transcriptional regulator
LQDISDYSEMQCPVHGLLTLLSGSWTTYILWLLQAQPELRFGELLRQMPGLSAKVLTERLRKLESAGLISRHPEPTIPPKVAYRLTERGRELHEPLQKLGALAKSWSGSEHSCPSLQRV